MRQACSKGQLETVKEIMSKCSFDLNSIKFNGITPFCAACYHGQIEVVKYLASDPRIDINQPNINEKTPFFIACENRHILIAEYLITFPDLVICEPNPSFKPKIQTLISEFKSSPSIQQSNLRKKFERDGF